MNKIFPFNLFPYLEQYECTYFTFNRFEDTFEEAIVRAKLMYRPGTYVISKYDNGLGNYLYVGESGYKKGRIVEQQLPYRIFKATCDLPQAYPDCDGARKLKRATAWKHMMTHDDLSTVVFFIFYVPLIEKN